MVDVAPHLVGVPVLVAGLFVFVEGLDRTGAIAALRDVIRITFEASITGAAWSAGILTAIACNP